MTSRPRFLLALWTVYVVWGSTYVAIKLSIRTLPPLLSAGGRFVLAPRCSPHSSPGAGAAYA